MQHLHLQLFAEGGTEGTAEAGGENSADANIDAEIYKHFGVKPEGFAEPTASAEENSQPATDETDNPDSIDAQEQTEAETETNPDEEFEQLIKGKFKEQFGKKAQGIINERFKNNRAAQQELDAVYDAFAPYMEKLGVKKGDVEGIKNAALDDASNFNKIAVEQGISVNEARESFRRGREEQTKRDAAQAQAAAEERRAIYDGWKNEEAEIKKTDPEFDLAKEIAGNEDFARALNSGLSVTFAYRATHFDERLAAAAGAVAKQTELNTARSIAANRRRPTEG
ncbi:MAG: hypothetical protein J1E34_09935, partial [Oscillospiraceae bacterium]|nr:hypothetical protein [Oscillospiraceae bacterium]